MRNQKRKMRRFSTAALVVLFLAGVAIMLYPTFSNWWNTTKVTHAVANYNTVVEQMDDQTKEELLAAAYAYNAALADVYAPLANPDAVPGYEEILNITDGIMGYVTIPALGVELPIYHGTSDAVLNVAVGHLQGSSFPVGGSSTHAVLSGHRGLPSARLFTDLDELIVGDEFTITVLDEVYTYQVDQISIVKPNEGNDLQIISGEDYVTLMTCTPYGINSHRLLVRGHRVETIYPRNVKTTGDAVQLDTLNVVACIAVPVFLLLVFWWVVGGRRKKKLTYEKFLEETKLADREGE